MLFMDHREIAVTVELTQMELGDAELEILAKDLQEMLDYFAQMSRIDVDGVEPTTHSLQKTMRPRNDVIQDSALADVLVERAPETEGRLIVIPNVL